MDPLTLSSLIGAGSSVLGGILGKPRRTSAQTNTRQGVLGQAQGAREAAEKYGFNPLTLLGASSPLGPTEGANYMGSAIAEAGLMLADGLAKRGEEAGLVSQLEAQNEELREHVQSLTLRPRVGGIYAERQAIPSVPASVGGVRPQARPSAPDHRGRVPVFNPFGHLVQILPDVAERLGVGAWDNLMPGDWAELVGEAGEVEVAIGMHNVRRTQLNTGVLFNDPAPLALSYGSLVGHAGVPYRPPVMVVPRTQSQHGVEWSDPSSGYVTGW